MDFQDVRTTLEEAIQRSDSIRNSHEFFILIHSIFGKLELFFESLEINDEQIDIFMDSIAQLRYEELIHCSCFRDMTRYINQDELITFNIRLHEFVRNTRFTNDD